jgi:hypothetical protein
VVLLQTLTVSCTRDVLALQELETAAGVLDVKMTGKLTACEQRLGGVAADTDCSAAPR